jgi:CheY-like chemotaxis protein
MPSIFLVEADRELRTSLKELLIGLGYEVWEFADGRVVAEKYREQNPDLVILNLILPEKDGFEIIQDLRRGDPCAKIVAMAGGGPGTTELYLRIARYLGALHTLSKPFTSEQFLEAVLSGLKPQLEHVSDTT